MSDDVAVPMFNSPPLAGLPPIAKAQVVQSINVALLVELLELLGGEARLPRGFADRVGAPAHDVKTRFEEDGAYVVSLAPLTDGPAVGTLWERMTGPRRHAEREVWRIETYGEGLCGLIRVDARTGLTVQGKPLAQVQTNHLRRGVGGWQRFTPPLEAIEATAGKPL